MNTENKPYQIELFARWPDMDFNQHMKNAAYLGASEDCRMRFLSEHGFTMEEFRTRKLGPVVLEDQLVYKKELKLLEPFRVDLALAASTADGRRIKIQNTFYRNSDHALVAIVSSVVIWLDLVSRKPIMPPDELKNIWFSLAKTKEFSWYE